MLVRTPCSKSLENDLMAYFKTSDFIGKVRKNDLARSNRFEIVINAPSNFSTDREVSLLCEEAQIPITDTMDTNKNKHMDGTTFMVLSILVIQQRLHFSVTITGM